MLIRIILKMIEIISSHSLVVIVILNILDRHCFKYILKLSVQLHLIIAYCVCVCGGGVGVGVGMWCCASSPLNF